MFPLVFSLVSFLVFFTFFTGSAPFVKDRAIRVLPYITVVQPYRCDDIPEDDLVVVDVTNPSRKSQILTSSYPAAGGDRQPS